MEFHTNAVFNHLRANQLNPEIQKETGQLYIYYKIHNFDIPLFFLLHMEHKVMQIVAYLPYQLQSNTLGEAARMLHFLNKETDMPGFGMDEKERVIFYRTAIPCLDNKIETRLFNMYLGATRIACETFMHMIGLIVSGTSKVDELVQNHSRLKATVN